MGITTPEKHDKEILKNALHKYITFLDKQLKDLASRFHSCYECKYDQGCLTYHIFDSEKERSQELLGFLEEDTPVSVDWLTPKVYKGSTEEETEEDLS